MTAASKALQDAENAILRAKLDGSPHLSLSSPELKELPASISDLSQLNRLNLVDLKVSDLSPLEGMVNLQHLYLRCHNLKGLEAISGLMGLKSLDLNNMDGADLSPIAKLPDLSRLGLFSCRGCSLAPLQGLAALRSLTLFSMWNADLSPLFEMNNLEELRLYYVSAKDFSALSGLNTLKSFSSIEVDWGDDSFLSGMKSLNELSISRGSIKDITSLELMTELTSLSLEKTRVADLSPLRALGKLEHVNLSGTKISDISAVSGLAELVSLKICDTKVDDLSPLAKLTNLAHLEVSGTRIGEMPALSCQSKLRTLDIARTKIESLSALMGFGELHTLNASETGISNISPLAEMVSLKSLNLRKTKVSDLSPLSDLTDLRTVDLSDTRVEDLTDLQNLKGLTQLYLSGAPLSEIGPLNKMVGLSELFLDRTNVADVSALAGLSLESLSLERTAVSDISPLINSQMLRRLNLNGTSVSDLGPVSKIPRLSTYSRDGGLEFRDTAAAKVHPTIENISKVKSERTRAKELFAFLNGPEFSLQVDAEAEQPTILPPHRAAPFVFVSYASVNRDYVSELRQFLSDEAISTWWDQDISPGATWRGIVAEQLEASNAVLTIWTKESVESKAVIEEASRAQALGKLVHVRVGAVRIPYGFGETQYIDLQSWDGSANHPTMKKLLQALKDRLEPPSVEVMSKRLMAASPVAMLAEAGKLTPKDTPPNVRPEIDNPADLDARLVGLRQKIDEASERVASRDQYQLPNELLHVMAALKSAAYASPVNWYSFDDSRASLCDCMAEHDAKTSWNGHLVKDLERISMRIAELQPLLQPQQIPAGQNGAKPPEPDPVVKAAQIAEFSELATQIASEFSSHEAAETLDYATREIVAVELRRVKGAQGEFEAEKKLPLLRRALRRLTYVTGGIVAAVSSGVIVSLLTEQSAALALAARLRPLYNLLLKYFL